MHIVARLQSGRDQESVTETYLAIAQNSGYHVIFALALICGALLFGLFQFAFASQRGQGSQALPNTIRITAVPAVAFFVVGGLLSLYQTTAAETLAGLAAESDRPAQLDDFRGLAGEIGLTLSGLSILLAGWQSAVTDRRGTWMLPLSVAAAFYGVSILFDLDTIHRIGSVAYFGWFGVNGALLILDK